MMISKTLERQQGERGAGVPAGDGIDRAVVFASPGWPAARTVNRAQQDEVAGRSDGEGAKRRTSLTRLKTAVLAPIPRASVETTTAVHAGVFRSWRTANLRSRSKTTG